LILLLGQISGASYVWCFGANGHTVLEQAHGLCCAEDKSQHDVLTLPVDGSEVAVEHSGPCLDLLPSGSYASQRLRDTLLSFESIAFTLPIVATFMRVASLPLQPQSIVADVVPRIREQIIYHRTIVLLN
jgi:hypothetical protein